MLTPYALDRRTGYYVKVKNAGGLLRMLVFQGPERSGEKSICLADLLFTREQFQEMARVIRYVKELLLHHAEPCTAEGWVGFALTLREVASVLELGLAEAALALGAFRRVADRALGRAGQPWYVSYRDRMGVK